MLELLILVLTILVLIWVTRRRAHFRYFKNLNINGPEPSLIFGNIWEYYTKKHFNAFRDWHEEYGPVVGVFIGYTPMLLVADVSLLRNVFIKDFTDFTDRGIIHGSIRTTSSLLTAKGLQWKNMRQISTPSFTSSKLKSLAPPMHAVVKELIDNLKSRANQDVNAKDLLQALTLDTICRSALGANYSVQKNIGDNDMFKSMKQFFNKDIDIFQVIGLALGADPAIINVIRSFAQRRANSWKDPLKKLLVECELIVKARRAAGTGSNDLLQLLMNASATLRSDVKADELTAGDEMETLNSNETFGGNAKLTDEQVVQNAFAILIAGFETTGSTLIYLVNALIHLPEIQDELREELRANIKSPEDMHDLEKLQRLAYMDAVVKETLRVFPPVGTFSIRIASRDKTYGKLRIPKGLYIIASVEEVHRNSELWSNPEEFDPSRFARGEPSDPIAWQPFGTGPRNCIGMRFAQMEIKMAVAEMLCNFRFERCARSPDFPPRREQLGVLTRLKGPLMCRVVPLN